MEKVVLNIDHYNELRDFKNKIEEGCTYAFYSSIFHSSKFITQDKAVKEVLAANKSLQNQIDILQITNLEIKKIKKMSIWEFLKWRKK